VSKNLRGLSFVPLTPVQEVASPSPLPLPSLAEQSSSQAEEKKRENDWHSDVAALTPSRIEAMTAAMLAPKKNAGSNSSGVAVTLPVGQSRSGNKTAAADKFDVGAVVNLNGLRLKLE
jgi:hypothetical protein